VFGKGPNGDWNKSAVSDGGVGRALLTSRRRLLARAGGEGKKEGETHFWHS